MMANSRPSKGCDTAPLGPAGQTSAEPLATASSAAVGAPHEKPRPSLSHVTILLVDDEAGVLNALTMILKVFGATVVPFPRADLALSALQAKPSNEPPLCPDIIISDLRMPGISGVEFFAALKESGSSLPFILMSGHASGPEVEEATSLGISGFVPKPFAPPQLIDQVLRLLPQVGAANTES